MPKICYILSFFDNFFFSPEHIFPRANSHVILPRAKETNAFRRNQRISTHFISSFRATLATLTLEQHSTFASPEQYSRELCLPRAIFSRTLPPQSNIFLPRAIFSRTLPPQSNIQYLSPQSNIQYLSPQSNIQYLSPQSNIYLPRAIFISPEQYSIFISPEQHFPPQSNIYLPRAIFPRMIGCEK